MGISLSNPMTNGVSRLIYGTAGFDLGVCRGLHLRNLEQAWSEGITHFDTAPIYAHGQAEAILGEFLRFHPDAQVNAKMGLSGRVLPRLPAAVFRLARRSAGLLVRSRQFAMCRRVDAPAERSKPLIGATSNALNLNRLKQSLNGSLRRLGLDSVPVLLLHEVNATAANHPATLEFMEGLRKLGIFQKAGIGGGNPALEQGALNPVYQFLQSEFYLGGRPWPEVAAPAHRENILYATLRPIKSLTTHLLDPNLAVKWRRDLDSSLAGTEGIAVWLMSWALYQIPRSRAVFFSANPAHIRDMARGIEPLLQNSQRLAVFESLYRSLPI
jgi:aryl-alcohol dehydrogenase-like predicted oxidoreductase